MTAVNIRHAGGAVTVEPDELLEHAVVRLTLPGAEIPLYPAEAVRLAVELIAAAYRAEHPVVDAWPEEEDQ